MTGTSKCRHTGSGLQVIPTVELRQTRTTGSPPSHDVLAREAEDWSGQKQLNSRTASKQKCIGNS
eukprot:CAMPEP_0194245034 /NCGR_PEP_ID=MMETSP0158-20130606/12354_1 /TAXON_ID=33649 /ORGANISM="Thalassionema nitzschioides, Strain L26-B" /LENGTH=64 /DNA_ID=CAMNT_0038980653 /DNA_START=463 /DNA_END=657 /DNA_ORIENTATION=-